MKKFLFAAWIVIVTIFIGVKVDATLFDYYDERGFTLPSKEDRAPLAVQCQIVQFSWQYQGTYDQNIALEQCLRDLEVFEPIIPFLGATTPRRPTEFKTFLNEQKTERHSDTTLKVTSVQTKDGFYIDPALLGDTIVLTINSGSSNSESILCTGLTTSTKTFSGCTFGYRFDDPLNTAPENVKAHSPGEPVIISNTDTFLANQYFTLDGENTTTGSTTFRGNFTISSTTASSSLNLGPGNTAYNKCLIVQNGDTDKAYICYNETAGSDELGRFVISHDGVNSFELITSTQGLASGGLGISVTNGVVAFDPVATSTSGLGYLGDQAIVATSSGGGITTDAGGVALNTSTGHVWLASSTFNGGLNARTATTSYATTTILNSTVVSSTNFVFNGINANNLAINSSTNAGSLHYHPTSTDAGTLFIPASGQTGSRIVPHNLGVTPSVITIIAVGGTSDGTNPNFGFSFGFSTSTVSAGGGQAHFGVLDETGRANASGFGSSTEHQIIYLPDDAGAADFDAYLTAKDPSSFTLNVVTNAGGTGSVGRILFWQAYK